MVSVNKSFLYGILCASVTWFISLYLYMQLTKTDNIENHLSLPMIRHEQNADIDEDLNEMGMVKTEYDQKVKEEGYKKHAFNVFLSNKLSYHRSIPDTRNSLCKSIKYELPLPTASIVICFYNEHLQTLLRTVHSILNRTPPETLREILLIDDYSDLDNLHEEVNNYLNKNNMKDKVRLCKTERREGLIRARIFGALRSKGNVLIFLDSHIEVNQGWVEPLLGRIKENRSHVVMPIIDIINPDTFAYSSSPLVRGGFNWGLHFKWENLPKDTLANKEDFVKPIRSPTMAGGLFAIDRLYFKEMGEYDAGMNVWGGENLEISFRIWMCGGTLELIPCSRVGHIFRHRRPYGAPDGQDTMLYNSLRLAHVWMDDYKDYYVKENKERQNTKFGDIASRIQLRKELNCKDFDWYLKNIYPELTLPDDNQERLKKKWAALEQDKYQPWHSRKRNYTNQYQIRLSNTSYCIQSSKDFKTKSSTLVLKPCMRSKAQIWYETDKHELVLAQLLCLQANKPAPILYKCHEMGGDQEWKHKGEDKSAVYNIGAGMCLGVKQKRVDATVTLKLCTDPDLNMWDFIK